MIARLGVVDAQAVERHFVVRGVDAQRRRRRTPRASRRVVAVAPRSASHSSGGRITGTIGSSNSRGELEVALVVRGHGHDRAGAVAHQHVVGDEDRDALVVRRVDRERRR